jgi:hypothetical protein
MGRHDLRSGPHGGEGGIGVIATIGVIGIGADTSLWSLSSTALAEITKNRCPGLPDDGPALTRAGSDAGHPPSYNSPCWRPRHASNVHPPM